MIEKIIIASLICTAIHVILKPGMIFHVIGEMMEIYLPELFSKPLGMCLTCMSSIYGTIIFFAWSGLGLIDFAPFILAVCGLNFIIDLFISLLQIIIEDTNENAGKSETSGY